LIDRWSTMDFIRAVLWLFKNPKTIPNDIENDDTHHNGKYRWAFNRIIHIRGEIKCALIIMLANLYSFLWFTENNDRSSYKGNNNHNDESSATAETTDGRFFNISVETACQEPLHESQQQIERPDPVLEIIEALPVPSDKVEHNEDPDETELSKQSRHRRKKKKQRERIAVLV